MHPNKTGAVEHAGSDKSSMDPNKTGAVEHAGSDKSSKVAATSTDEAERAGSLKLSKQAATSTDEAELAGSKKSPDQAAAERAGSGKSPKAAATSTDEAARRPPHLTQVENEVCLSMGDSPCGNIFPPILYIRREESRFVKGLYVLLSEEDDGNGNGDGDDEGDVDVDRRAYESVGKPTLLLQNIQMDEFDSPTFGKALNFTTEPPMMDYASIGGGLSNINSKSCFINAILQCLVHTVPFLDVIGTKCSCNGKKFCAWCCLHSLFLSLTAGSPYVEPKKLVHNIHRILFLMSILQIDLQSMTLELKLELGCHLQLTLHISLIMILNLLLDFSERFKNKKGDAHEFLSKARSVLMESHKDGNALIKGVFGGHLFNKYTCHECHNSTQNSEELLDLQLPITEDAHSLLYALQKYTKSEVSDYHCKKCGTNDATHDIQLYQLPQILTFQLKRFDGVQKIIRKLKFLLELDLDSPTVTQDAKCKYHLYAIVVHKGQKTYSGHYYSFIRVSATDWYEFNDEAIKRVDEEHVLDQEAYILFYAKEGTPWFAEAIKIYRASTSTSSHVLEDEGASTSTSSDDERASTSTSSHDERASTSTSSHVLEDEGGENIPMKRSKYLDFFDQEIFDYFLQSTIIACSQLQEVSSLITSAKEVLKKLETLQNSTPYVLGLGVAFVVVQLLGGVKGPKKGG